ncbi:hypothetical protein [Roseivivax sp. THAF30]|jgi:hypothetical protein|uniref:hypothetical protein n=1 Tax=Roseivivax sp. THAF30 TaxID=2587852 RepID=UPI0012A81019|nr:hypothetical protein [Roseivivax sp. THAF30]QFT61494.1 hypothetical protein FIU91_01025 [Roseivivax sp. THAF30]
MHQTLVSSEIATRRIEMLRSPEARFLVMLRLWPEGAEAQAQVWSGLCHDLGAGRARACLSAFEDLDRILRKSAWHMPRLGDPGDAALTPDEDALCRFLLVSLEAEREAALAEAMFLVRPDAILPVTLAASRVALPLLCVECRLRLEGARCRRIS